MLSQLNLLSWVPISSRVSSPATFVLIHGAWCWQKIQTQLTLAGQWVTVLTSGHSPLLSIPQQLAASLEELAFSDPARVLLTP